MAVRVVKSFVGNPFDADAIAAHHDAIVAAPWLAGMATPSAEPRRRSVSLRVLCMFPDVEADHKVLDSFDDEAHRLADEAYDAGGDGVAAAETASRRRAIAEQKLSVRFGSIVEAVVGVDVDCVDPDCDLSNGVETILPGSGWQTKKVDLVDYDLVLVDEDWRPACAAVAVLPPSSVVYVAAVKQEHTDPRSRRYRIPATLTTLLRRLGDEVDLRRQQIAMPWAVPLPIVPAPSLDDAEVDARIIA